MDSEKISPIVKEPISNQIIEETIIVIKQHKGGTDSVLFEVDNNGEKLTLKLENKILL